MGTFVVLLILIALVAGAVYSMYQDKKKGRHSCGGSCGGCAGCSKGCRMAAPPEKDI